MKMQTYFHIRKAFVLYTVVVVTSLALPACVKGFKTEIKDVPESKGEIFTPKSPPNAAFVTPRFELNLSPENASAIIKFISDNDAASQTILNDPKFMGPPLIAGYFDLGLIGLDSNQSQSGVGSVVRFQAIVSASEKVGINIESKDAHLSLSKSNEITGYWDSTVGQVPIRIEIEAVVTKDDQSLTIYTLDGTLGIVLGDVHQSLGTFSVPLCSVIDNASFLNDPSIACGK